MTASRELARKRVKRTGLPLWWDKLVAIAAAVNLALIVFDLTYIPLRDFWLQGKVRPGSFKIGPIESQGYQLEVLPDAVTDFITQYDAIKGIEPYRDTAQYLERVEELESTIVRTSLNSAATATILDDLRDRSAEIIDTNPFELANKTGTLERIKNKLRDRVPNPQNSSKQAFASFWSQDYLSGQTFEELAFFEEEIAPLFARNYFRPIGENGEFVDYFGLIDFPFFCLFAFDFFGRTWNISRRRAGISWLDAMLWRWYDIFLLIPVFRWLRVIPVIIRLNEAHLGVNLAPIKKQASQGLVAGIAEDVTEVVVVRIINQLQDSIRQGEIAKLLTQRSAREYIDLNQTDETSEIAKLVSQITVYKVLPTVRPDLEALLEYNIEKIWHSLPAYDGLRHLPGIKQLERGLTEQLVKQIYQGAYGALNGALEADPVADELWRRLVEHFSEAISTEIGAKQSVEKLEFLLSDLLEEVKINYVERLSDEDVEEILEQTRSLRQLGASSRIKPAR